MYFCDILISEENYNVKGAIVMTVAEFLNDIINKKKMTKAALAEQLKIKPNNLQNKINRDNFTSLELTEIADVLDCQILYRDKETGEEYIIDYPQELKFKPKRIEKKFYSQVSINLIKRKRFSNPNGKLKRIILPHKRG